MQQTEVLPGCFVPRQWIGPKGARSEEQVAGALRRENQRASVEAMVKNRAPLLSMCPGRLQATTSGSRTAVGQPQRKDERPSNSKLTNVRTSEFVQIPAESNRHPGTLRKKGMPALLLQPSIEASAGHSILAWCDAVVLWQMRPRRKRAATDLSR